MIELSIADFPFCFNVIPLMDNLLERNETFQLHLETIDDGIMVNTSPAIFIIVDNVSSH